MLKRIICSAHLLVSGALLCVLGNVHAVENATSQVSPDNVMTWVTNYYKSPDPDEIVEAINATFRWAELKNAPPNARVLPVMFYGKIMEANPDKIENWMAELKTLPDKNYEQVCNAVRYSGTDVGMAWLKANGHEEIANYQVPAMLDDANPCLPIHFDELCQWFFATGEKEPIAKITFFLEFADKMPPADNLDLLSPPEKPSQEVIDAFKKEKNDQKLKLNPMTLYQVRLSNFQMASPAIRSIISVASKHPRMQQHLQALAGTSKKPKVNAWIERILKVIESQKAKHSPTGKQ